MPAFQIDLDLGGSEVGFHACVMYLANFCATERGLKHARNVYVKQLCSFSMYEFINIVMFG